MPEGVLSVSSRHLVQDVAIIMESRAEQVSDVRHIQKYAHSTHYTDIFYSGTTINLKSLNQLSCQSQI